MNSQAFSATSLDFGSVTEKATGHVRRPAFAHEWRRAAENFDDGCWRDTDGAYVTVTGGPDLQVTDEDIAQLADSMTEIAWVRHLAEMSLHPLESIPEPVVNEAYFECTRIILDRRSGMGARPRTRAVLEAVAAAEQQDAIIRARSRADWYIRFRGGSSALTPFRLQGPYTRKDARAELAKVIRAGGTGQLLSVAEDYDS